MTVGQGDRCELRPDAELLEHRSDLRSDGGHRHEVRLGNLLGVEALHHGGENERFALRQLVEGRLRTKGR